MILTLIPIFTFLIYPAVDKVFTLTPLRKVSIGLFIMVSSFALITLIQTWIDAGENPSIAWQVLAYILLTSSEVMVSIVCLEFAYTQAPKSLKSLLMAIFLLSVALGNFFAAQINSYIQIGSPPSPPGETEIQFKDEETFTKTVEILKLEIEQNSKLLTREEGNKLIGTVTDSFGNPIKYEILNSKTARIRSNGADNKSHTKWDTGIMLKINSKSDPDAKKTWLEKRQEKLEVTADSDEFELVTTTNFIGGSSGMTTMEGASYFRFFTYIMLGTAILFIPFCLLYTYNVYEEDEK